MNQEIDFSTLTWVKKELDETLKQARQSLEAHVDNPQDDAQLGFLAAHLHQVYGTLQMVELYGASLLAEEMEQVARAIAAKTVTRNDDACEVLMRAILQLPDYLDRLIAGYRDIPLVLLPILNDLRAVRGETLLSETHMFSPDLNAALPESVANRRNDGDIQARAKELRHRFQLGLLAWFKGQDPQQAMTPLAEVLEQLVGLSSSDQLARFWWVSAGLADALKTGKLKSSVAINRLMGQVDRHIKSVVDDGEAALAQNVSEDLLKNLLFYVAQVRDAGPRVAAIQETYRLTDLLPGEEELAAARESLAGQNADLFETVAVAVKEELARLKDSLDIVLRSGCTNAEELQPLIVSLRSLGDTLGMLSLGAPRKAVVSKAEGLQRYVDGGDTPPDAALMDVASTLLFVESSVDGMGSGRVAPDSEAAVEEQLAESEFNQVMNVVVEEAITDLVRAKDAIASFAESSSSAEALQEVPQWFNQVKGGLLLLGDTRAAALMDAVARYVDEELIRQQNQPAQQELESLADAVCGLEYYLESRKEHRMYGGSAITVAEQSVEKLGYSVETSEYSAEPGVAELPEGESVQVDEQSDTFAVESAATTDEMPLQDVGADVAEQAVEHADPDLPATGDAQETGGFAIELESQVSPPHERAPVEDIPELSRDDSVSQDTEHESDIAAQQAETQAEQIEDEDDGLAVIGDELDEEILEIFIEEAEEEIASINEQLPVWIKDHENADALATIRRSYHTLKGSGRLVGAMRIGEFAWAHENMLNRVIDGTVAISPALTGLLESACVALPELVQQIKDGTPTRQPIASLMRCADAISKGSAA
jgi:chemosensory pili system protein ChpA (sensor histidine kinase/response regulator)